MMPRILAAATLALAAISANAGAETPQQPAGAAAAPAPDPFEQAMAARGVAEFARREKDPLAMLTAARMLKEIPVTGDAERASFSPEALFAEARALADGDTLLLQQITIAESTGQRGVLSSAFGSGLVRRVLDVDPRGAFQFTVNAKGGEMLRLGAIGDPGTNLLMRIQDRSGHVVCLDDHGDYAPVCQLTPRSNASYRVDILNKSADPSRTVVLSN